MKRLTGAGVAFLLLLRAVTADAVSISGIVLYAADDFGTPNGLATITDDQLSAQLWRTAIAGPWHGLGVWYGTPPECFATPPLNAPNFMVEIPLMQGENVFTLVGEPGALTRTDDYLRFTINLYFDGYIQGPPGISVIFDRYAPPGGGPVGANRSDFIYSLLLERQPSAQSSTFYDDGIDRVTVTAASFLPPERFNPEWNFDFLGMQRFGKSGEKDFLGVLKLQVDVSQGDGTGNDGVAPKGIFRAGGGLGSGTGVPGAYGVPAGGPNAGYGDLPPRDQQPANPYAQQAARPTTAPTARAEDEEESLPEPTAGETPDGTPEPKSTAAAGTPTPKRTGTGEATTPTPGRTGTTSPKPAEGSGTPTARAPGTSAAVTPTPGARRTPPAR
jgi:hypothetical protein